MKEKSDDDVSVKDRKAKEKWRSKRSHWGSQSVKGGVYLKENWPSKGQAHSFD